MAGEIVATIGAGASLSQDLEVPEPSAIVGIVMPSTWTAANLTFQGSADGLEAPRNIHNAAGDEYTVTADADRFIALDPADFAGVRFLRVRSGTAAVPVNQVAERKIRLLTRQV
jgi:hypothetical protein